MMRAIVEPFEAYKLYLALKNHFSQSSYDFFKYNGKVKANYDSFNVRKDKYFFYKLSKKKDVVQYLVANFIDGKNHQWVGDLVQHEEAEAIYAEWQRRQQALTYTFKQDIEKLKEDFNSNFVVKNGQHPFLLKLVLRRDISLETFIILNDIVRFTSVWNKHIEDTMVWPEFYMKCKKYRPFLKYEIAKFKQILKEKYS